VDAVGGTVATFPEAAGVVSLPPADDEGGGASVRPVVEPELAAGDSAGLESMAVVVAVSSSSLHAGANAARIAAAAHHRFAPPLT
jgi:hypothetical protein